MRLLAVQALERASHARPAEHAATEQDSEPQRETQLRESLAGARIGRRPDRDGGRRAGTQDGGAGRKVAQQDPEEARPDTRPLAVVWMQEAVDRIARERARERASARLDVLGAQDASDRRAPHGRAGC